MSEKICDGVKILVERMRTNPEEFLDDFGKWDGLIKSPWHEEVTDWVAALNPTEIAMLKEARRGVYREKFTAQVMKTLLTVDDAPKQPNATLTTNPFRHSPNTPNPNLAQNGYNPYQNSAIAVGSAGGGGTIGLGSGTGTNAVVNAVITDSMMERFEKVWNKYKKEGGK